MVKQRLQGRAPKFTRAVDGVLHLCQSCGRASNSGFGLFSDRLAFLLPLAQSYHNYLPFALLQHQPWVQEEHIESIPPVAWRISENTCENLMFRPLSCQARISVRFHPIISTISSNSHQTRASTSRNAINDAPSSRGLMVPRVRQKLYQRHLEHHSNPFVSGCAIVTLDAAYLFTDGRYFLQAEKQLDKLRTVSLLPLYPMLIKY